MGNVWGKNIQLSIFGESHNKAVGMVLSGLPAGFAVDWDYVANQMKRRAPGGALRTARVESDAWEILSGEFNGKTTGAPLCAVIRNSDARSEDYDPDIIRPSHADLTAHYKYKGYSDYRGGGHFSGRLTAPVVLAGAVARQILKLYGITIGARICQIGNIFDKAASAQEIILASEKEFPAVDDDTAEKMKAEILRAKEEGDSVGGVVECTALGACAGLGEPFFDSAESVISSFMFSIPAVKGIEFGSGFKLSGMRGSEANDELFYLGDKIRFKSNNNGGINGGITNGEPIVFRVAIKPTPTISKEQTSVNIRTKETVKTSFGGRHDPCIALRAVSVIEAALAVCLLDLINVSVKEE